MQVRIALDIFDNEERDAGEILERILLDMHQSLDIWIPGSYVLSHYANYNCNSNPNHSWVSKRLASSGDREQLFTFHLYLGGDSDAPPYPRVNKERPVSILHIFRAYLEPDLAERRPNDINHR